MNLNIPFSKTIFFFIIAVLTKVGSISAQDLIVTNSGDSLNCKITKVETDFVHFIFKHKSEAKATLINKNQLRYYKKAFYLEPDISRDEKIAVKFSYPRLRLGINGGWSSRIAKVSDNVPSDFKNYIKELKSGYSFGFEGTYFISEQFGLGLKYSRYAASNEIDNIYMQHEDGTREYGKLSDDIKIDFFGPMITTRVWDKRKKNCFVSSWQFGYMNYNNEAVMIDHFTHKGSTFGMGFDLGYDIYLSKESALGFQFSLILGTLTQMSTSDGVTTKTRKLEKEEYESLGRIDLSIGFRFNN